VIRSRMTSVTLGAALVCVLVLVLGFLALPVVALLTRNPPHEVIHELHSGVAADALRISLECSAISIALIVLFGTPLAYALGRTRFPGRAVLITVLELPLVLPPAAAGIALLVAYGRFGLIGGTLHSLHISLAFNKAAVIAAITFVSSPFYIRSAIAAFETVDPVLLDVSATLGAGRLRRMLRVAMPLASAGLGAGAALAFARGMGEFGATILFAGSLQGVTQTLSLAVYSQFEQNLNTAVAIGALLVVISAAVLLSAKLLPAWIRWRSRSASRAVISTST
jgi:molybdate transport system permease protein